MAVSTGTSTRDDPARRMAEVTMTDRLYRLVRGIVRAVCRMYWRVEVDREAELPETGPLILAPVHRSFIDFFVVSEVSRRKLFYMAKEELWKRPRFGRFLEALGAFPVHRQGTDRLALDRAQAVLERGDVLILFPEGTRRSGPAVQDIHEGATFLAARTGAPVVPIGVGGTADAMRKGARLPRPHKVRLVVGAPLTPPARGERGRVARHRVREMSETLRVELERLYAAAEGRDGGT